MSLYNLVHGVNSYSPLILTMLGLQPQDCGRFRDAWFEADRKSVIVLTRNGGGNRPDYQDINDNLARHPHAIENFDDEFDNTYAHFRFKIPPEYTDIVANLEDVPTPLSLEEKTTTAIHNMSKADAAKLMKEIGLDKALGIDVDNVT